MQIKTLQMSICFNIEICFKKELILSSTACETVAYCCVFMPEVAAVFHATLSLPSSISDIQSIETNIVSQIRSLSVKNSNQQEDYERKKQVLTELHDRLKELGVEGWRFTLSKQDSIASHFVCDSAEQLRTLGGHFESGLMKDALEKIFTLLAGKVVSICQLGWSPEEYNDCLQQTGW